MTTIALIHPQATVAMLGFIPSWLTLSDEKAKFVDIVNFHYVGSWHSHKGGTMNTSNGDYSFPGDPVMKPYAAIMRATAGEMIFAYQYAFFAVVTLTQAAQDAALKGDPMPSDMAWDMARLD